MALAPTVFQAGLPSGKSASRAGIGRVPIFCFQAWGSPGRPRPLSKPTPRELFCGGSAIIVIVIRFNRLSGNLFRILNSHKPRLHLRHTLAFTVREYSGGGTAGIGLSNKNRKFAH